MKKLLLILLVTTAIAGCNKENDPYNYRPDCEINDQGSISVRSTQDESYYVYIDGVSRGVIGAYQTASFSNIAAGTHLVQTKEVNYVFIQDCTRCQVYADLMDMVELMGQLHHITRPKPE